jgi:hypothetical protein
MKKYMVLLAAVSIVLVSILPAIYICVKSLEGFQALFTDGNMTDAFESFSEQVEEGLYSNEQIASKFLSLAAANEQVESGLVSMIETYYIFILGLIFAGAAQFLLILALIKNIEATSK